MDTNAHTYLAPPPTHLPSCFLSLLTLFPPSPPLLPALLRPLATFSYMATAEIINCLVASVRPLLFPPLPSTPLALSLIYPSTHITSPLTHIQQPKLDILQLREYSRLGLPDSTSRIRVWPLLLGLSSKDLANDKETYRVFTETHNQGKLLCSTFEHEKQAYLVLKRAWNDRKLEHEALCTSLEHRNLDLSASDTENDEIQENQLLEVVPFLEPAPIPPETPIYPTRFWEQITKDVDRSLWKQVPEESSRNLARDKLHRMICAVLCTAKDDEGKPLHYFQGYHDVAGVFLLTCGEELGFSLLRRLSVTYLRYEMMKFISVVVNLYRHVFLTFLVDENIEIRCKNELIIW